MSVFTDEEVVKYLRRAAEKAQERDDEFAQGEAWGFKKAARFVEDHFRRREAA